MVLFNHFLTLALAEAIKGRFLLGILTDLWKWHEDEALFIQDNRTRSGGKTILHPGLQIRWTSKTTIAPEDVLKWPGFKQILRKWHRKLAKVSSLYFRQASKHNSF
jgi:Transcription factor/nuclear export subunit protein 2